MAKGLTVRTNSLVVSLLCLAACTGQTPATARPPTPGTADSGETSTEVATTGIEYEDGVMCHGEHYPFTAHCSTDAPLGCACGSLTYWTANEYRASEFVQYLSGEACTGLSFLDLAYLLGLERENAYPESYRCVNESYDVVFFSSPDYGIEDSSIYFDSAGEMFAIAQSDRTGTEIVCPTLTWGGPIGPCDDRVDYTPEDFQILFGL